MLKNTSCKLSVVLLSTVLVDIGGQFKLSLPPGLYEMAIAVKESKSKRAVQRTVAFTVEP
jgi:hypothetical protein